MLLNRTLLLLAVFAVLAGCGQQAAVDPRSLMAQLASPDGTRAQEALRELGRRAQADPERVVPLLIEELVMLRRAEAAIVARVVPDLTGIGDAARPEVMMGLTRLLRSRLIEAGFTLSHLRQTGGEVEVHLVPPADPKLGSWVRERLLAELGRQGGFELRAEVPAPFATTPERPRSPWPGDAASYAAWRQAEDERWKAAGGDLARYVPARSDVALVPTLDDAPEAQGTPVVALGLPEAATPPLSERDFVLGVRDDPVLGTPALYLVPRGGSEQRVRTGLAAFAGLTVWVVVDGRAVIAARLPGAPGTAVSFPVHGSDMAQARTRAAALATRLGAGRMAFPARVEPLEPPVGIPLSHPICEALILAGQAAEPHLLALVQREPALRPLVQRIHEEVVTRRSR